MLEQKPTQSITYHDLTPSQKRINNLLKELYPEYNKYHQKHFEVLNRYSPAPDLLWSQRFIYEEDPFIYRYLDVKKRFAQYIPLIKASNFHQVTPQPKQLEKDINENPFPYKIGGLSLEDIERMPLPLSIENIQRINRFFGGKYGINLIFLRFSPIQLDIYNSLMFFIVQKYARVDIKINIPPSVLPLHQRLTGYFDYYVNLLQDSSLSTQEAEDLFINITRRMPYLPSGLFLYLPARIGITPSSTIKLFYNQALNSRYTSLYNALINKYTDFVKIPPEYLNLPNDLHHFAYYDQAIDSNAQQQLDPYLKSASQTQNNDLENTFYRLKSYKKTIFSQIHHSPNQRLTIPLNSFDPSYKELLITSRNKKSLMLILFNSPQNYLTLDLTSENRLLGIPPKTQYNFPNSEKVLATKLLDPLLEYFYKQFPRLEPISFPPTYTSNGTEDKTIIQPINRSRKYSKSSTAPPSVLFTLQPENIRPLKRRRLRQLGLLKPLTDSLDEPPLPTSTSTTVHEPTYNLEYSRGLLFDLMGKNTPEKIIDQLMHDLHDFIYDKSNKKKSLKGEWDGHIEIKSCGYRLILKPEGKRRYTLVDAGKRNNIFS